MTRHSLSRTALATLLIIALHAPLAFAGAIWTDANDDGLPDGPGTLLVAAGDVVSVDLWIDSQSFAWSNFLVYAEWTPGCFSYVSGEYIIADGTNFPIDSFSHPYGVGFGGFAYNHQGVDAIATFNVRALTAGVCCVMPIIDPYNPYSTFSQLGTESEYFLFTSNPISCWTVSSTPQACCFADGSCSFVMPEECTAAGGAPQGVGTTCANVVCDQPTPRGACCAPDAACADNVTAAECAALGGVYQGNDTDCSMVSCPQPRGACCFVDGSCQFVDAAACAAAGGDYRGDFTSCATANCPLPSGACCLPSGACLESRTSVQCAASGGVYQGDNTVCANVDCPQPPTGACCLPSGQCTGPITASECAAIGGAYQGNDTACANVNCPQPIGACCVADSCVGELTRADCQSIGGSYRGDGTTCATPLVCALPPGCAGAGTPGVPSAFPLREFAGIASQSSAQANPCALAANTNGTSANYRWYNVCSGYIWIYTGLAQGEGVGVSFGGAEQPGVNGDTDVKRTITYFRNVCMNYNQTVDVFVDTDANEDGCPDYNIASDLNVDPGLRWNCSDFNTSIPCGDRFVIVRTVHDGGFSPAFATDGAFSATCDPNAPGRSYYYGVNGSACNPWRGPDGTFDNFLYWLILDESAPCVNAVEPTTWGRIKGMYR